MRLLFKRQNIRFLVFFSEHGRSSTVGEALCLGRIEFSLRDFELRSDPPEECFACSLVQAKFDAGGVPGVGGGAFSNTRARAVGEDLSANCFFGDAVVVTSVQDGTFNLIDGQVVFRGVLNGSLEVKVDSGRFEFAEGYGSGEGGDEGNGEGSGGHDEFVDKYYFNF